MENVLNIASYIATRYKKETGMEIDEMKLHKLLYFAQREALILNLGPIFEDSFEAWKFGPVMVSVRDWFKQGMPEMKMSEETESKFQKAFDNIFEFYARKSSWDLSVLTHGDDCWINAENNKTPGKICADDIMQDADIIRDRYNQFYSKR